MTSPQQPQPEDELILRMEVVKHLAELVQKTRKSKTMLDDARAAGGVADKLLSLMSAREQAAEAKGGRRGREKLLKALGKPLELRNDEGLLVIGFSEWRIHTTAKKLDATLQREEPSDE